MLIMNHHYVTQTAEQQNGFQRMQVFMLSRHAKAYWDSMALARQLVPVLASFTRIWLGVKDKRADSVSGLQLYFSLE